MDLSKSYNTVCPRPESYNSLFDSCDVPKALTSGASNFC